MTVDNESDGPYCNTIPSATDFLELNQQEQAKILQFQLDVLNLVVLGYDSRLVCEKLCALEEQLLPNAVASIMLLDDGGKTLNVFVAPSIPREGIEQLNGLKPGPGAGSCGNAVYRGEPVFVENTFADPRWQDIRHLATNFNICACWSLPIHGKGGRIIGTFALSSFEHRKPGAFHRKLLEIGAYIVGIVLEQQKTSQQLYLSGKVFEYSTEGIIITDASNRIVAVNRAFTRITGYSFEEVQGKNPAILSSNRHDKAFYQAMWSRMREHGHWQGEIWNKNHAGQIYPEWLSISAIQDSTGAVTHYLGIFSDISEKKRADEIIWRQANFDFLTGLPNRHRFYERLLHAVKKARSRHQRLALLFIDLDRFKEVNDTMGHGSGDSLLKIVADRLLNCIRDGDLLARLGGDEFTVILHDIADADTIGQLAQHMLNCLAEPFKLDGHALYVSASIGITLYPDDAQDCDTLLKNADQAMYAAKQQGRNRWRYFMPEIQLAAEKRARMAGDLRTALQDGQFHLAFQPIVDLATGRVGKAEALIRWQHPQLGLVSPADFIPVAEETGLIVDIGEWVFSQAAEQVALWQSAYEQDFQISINKSPVQFHHEASRDWSKQLAAKGLSGHSIVVEITEGLLLDASKQVSQKLLEFRDAGIQVAIDDFGTGYSSLSYLKKFDIDYLKIDQSFVRNLAPESSDLVLCEAIVTMAHRLGMKVVAEGVETQQQCNLLATAGCDFAQGYLFARPLPADEFEILMRNHNCRLK